MVGQRLCQNAANVWFCRGTLVALRQCDGKGLVDHDAATAALAADRNAGLFSIPLYGYQTRHQLTGTSNNQASMTNDPSNAKLEDPNYLTRADVSCFAHWRLDF